MLLYMLLLLVPLAQAREMPLAKDTFTTRDVNPCDGKELDVVFIIDTSNSMGNTRFQKVKDLVHQIVLQLDISATLTRVGFITFSQQSVRWLELGALNDKTAVLDLLDTIGYESSITNTHLAIYDFTDMLTLHGRSDVVQIGAIITDGMSTDNDELMQSLIALYDAHADAKLIVVSVDDPSDLNALQASEMMAMATGVGEENLIQVDNFDALSGIFEEFRTLICDSNTNAVPAAKTNAVVDYCSQYVVTNTSDATTDGSMFKGVYEINQAMGLCNGRPIFQHTTGSHWLSLLTFQGNTVWTITFHDPTDTSCDLPLSGTYALAHLAPDASTPDGHVYYEVATNKVEDMQVVCLIGGGD